MRKLVVPLLLLFLLTGCADGNNAGASAPQPSAPTPAATEDIRIKPEELKLFAGETAALACQSASGDAVADVTWTVEDESIATISGDGEVTAVSKGETTATAVQKDAPNVTATCRIIVLEQESPQADLANGATIEIHDKREDIVAQDGTKLVIIFDMQAVSETGVFKGKAVLQSIGVKDTDSGIPFAGAMSAVSSVEFTLTPASKEPVTVEMEDGLLELAPLMAVDYEGKGTLALILTDVAAMALETKVTDDEPFLEIPFELIVADDKVGIGFSMPDGQYITFQGEITLTPEA